MQPALGRTGFGCEIPVELLRTLHTIYTLAIYRFYHSLEALG